MIVFDGLGPTMDYSKSFVVLGFEAVTILVELAVVWAFMKWSHANNRSMRYALIGSMAANLVSFFVGALIYTYMNGSEWLVTVWGAGYFDYGLATVTAIFGILIFLSFLSGLLLWFFYYIYPDKEIDKH